MFKLSAAAVTLTAASQVLAHGGVLSYSWGGQWYWGFKPYNTPTGQVTIQREWDTYDPIQDATASTIACNSVGTALPSGQQLTGTAAAGTAVTAYWNNPWPHPYGPMLTYMANCNGSCDSAVAQNLDWFKIDESGLISGTVASGYWGSGKMIDTNNTWTSTIPSCIPAGNYLLRFETIALHSQPAQWYPECAQITVTGGGSTVPANTCKFPGCYSNSDPGTAIDIYGQAAQTQTTYVIPGPALFTCGGSNTKSTTTTTTTKTSSTSSTRTSSTTTTSTKTSSTTTTTTKTSSTTTASGATQTQYGQCGGTGYTGPTVCASPYTCTYANAYYSQVIPLSQKPFESLLSLAPTRSAYAATKEARAATRAFLDSEDGKKWFRYRGLQTNAPLYFPSSKGHPAQRDTLPDKPFGVEFPPPPTPAEPAEGTDEPLIEDEVLVPRTPGRKASTRLKNRRMDE